MAALETESAEPNLTGEELAKLLGVTERPDDPNFVVTFFNACIKVQTNPTVQALPDSERVRAIRSAMHAMGMILGG
jgi:hypothetical protein